MVAPHGRRMRSARACAHHSRRVHGQLGLEASGFKVEVQGPELRRQILPGIVEPLA
jgi:hypothetical protein